MAGIPWWLVIIAAVALLIIVLAYIGRPPRV